MYPFVGFAVALVACALLEDYCSFDVFCRIRRFEIMFPLLGIAAWEAFAEGVALAVSVYKAVKG